MPVAAIRRLFLYFVIYLSTSYLIYLSTVYLLYAIPRSFFYFVFEFFFKKKLFVYCVFALCYPPFVFLTLYLSYLSTLFVFVYFVCICLC